MEAAKRAGGRSPRVRGRRVFVASIERVGRPIPACAGETKVTCSPKTDPFKMRKSDPGGAHAQEPIRRTNHSPWSKSKAELRSRMFAGSVEWPKGKPWYKLRERLS